MDQGSSAQSVTHHSFSDDATAQPCFVCPYCPKTCIVVYRTRKLLQEHVRSDTGHSSQSVPEEQDLETVRGEKGLHNSRLKWLRIQPVQMADIALPEFSMHGFRYQSKFENRLHLLEKHKRHVDVDHPGFEMRIIGKDLKFNADAILFLKRIEAASKQTRYRVRQFAKRDQLGTLKLSGFEFLHCENSVRSYARTIARFVYFAISSVQNGAKFQSACEHFRDRVAAKDDASSEMRCNAFEDLLFEAVKQPQTVDGFSACTFIDLFYVVAPNGHVNRTADFVRHAAVHLIYAMRGVFIIMCERNFCPEQHEQMSLKFLNEQVESAYSSVQDRKRVAASCLESLECKLQWRNPSELEVLTPRGNVSVSIFLMHMMYKDLLERCRKILSLMGCPTLSNDMIMRVRDPSSKVPGEGILSMNEIIFQEFITIHPRVLQTFGSLKSIKEKKNFCGQIYTAGKTLVKALYMVGGPSARLTEISAWMVSNSDVNHERNVRFVRNLVAIVNTYSKSHGAGISEQKVVCFADEELTGYVLTYLIVLKRFECLVIKDVPEFGSEAEKCSRVCFLIDKGKPVDGPKLGRMFREEWISQNLDVGIADMRQVLEAFARKEGCLLDVVPSNPLLQMANHTSKSSNSTYGRCFGLDLPQIDSDMMEECWRYSHLWNTNVLGCNSSPSKSFTTAEAINSSAVALTVSGKADENVADVATSARPSKAISSIPPIAVSPASYKRTIQSQSETQGGFGPSHTESLKRACHAIETEDFKLREKQKEMMQFLNSNKEHHSLFILPTGSGKTKVVLLDSIARNVCNVIFVPLKLIEEDILKAKVHHPGSIIMSWNSIKHDFEAAALRADVIVASYEHACQGMIPFFQCLERNGRIGYCFIDEADTLLQQHRHFDHFWALTASSSLLKIKAMTATLRPRDKVHVQTKLGLTFDSELRYSCRRDDVDVSCRFMSTEHAVEAGLQLFLEQVLKIESSRILIFCMSIAETDYLGALLGKVFPNQVSICHSKRRENLNRISVVTSCVASGLNVEGLSHVIIVKSTWSIESFLQVCLIRA